MPTLWSGHCCVRLSVLCIALPLDVQGGTKGGLELSARFGAVASSIRRHTIESKMDAPSSACYKKSLWL